MLLPEGLVLTRGENSLKYKGLFPAVVKPTRMENSVGVELVQDKAEMEAALERAFDYGDTAVVDMFKPGREIRCGAVELVRGKLQALGCIEYQVGKDKIRTFEDKLDGNDNDLRQATYNIT